METTKTLGGTVAVVTGLPEGFVSFTRGWYRSEASAVAAARKYAKTGVAVLVVYTPATRLYTESWIVGRVSA